MIEKEKREGWEKRRTVEMENQTEQQLKKQLSGLFSCESTYEETEKRWKYQLLKSLIYFHFFSLSCSLNHGICMIDIYMIYIW